MSFGKEFLAQPLRPDNEPRTLKEIGEQLGLTRERVRQIETEALRKMAESLDDPRELELELAGL